MIGALYRYLREADVRHFQPMNANFGLLDELVVVPRDKTVKRECYAERALGEIGVWAGGLAGAARSEVTSTAVSSQL